MRRIMIITGLLLCAGYQCISAQVADSTFDIFNRLTIPFTTSKSWDYPCADFQLNGRACKIVKPRTAAAGHPWIWRARFWGHEPQTDIALLERGFHVVYCDVAELFGNDQAITLWNSFYQYVRKAGLAEKVVMEGMSRGAVYVYNWAAVNPDKVAAVYVDNPVLDLKSWPGGKGKGPGSKENWELFRKDFGFITDSIASLSAVSPIDKVAQIVKGGYPMLHLCADADEVVPPGENTLLFEERVKALKGNITVIHKPGFKHHPHSLPDPAPIVDFILKAVYPPKK